ncbi:MAG: hypothetical protein KJ856_07810 [Gammaproteobacteria bacterium]|nr:hypothetical protein [Gammaproteobacteria bacterium]MBU1479815.1 hypothetical protein [Gammaproteobacteria bacterium]MBU1999505.1 hypothetical protein [Gammaproteobacteria bacterium]MBU2130686.1 hypothetical protein [Gammaproteobacteria bacterium]MBU2186924.1 hypothetical protein [Gammaproteobacteria bacterium]
MFIPPNYLKILATVFESTGIAKGTARNDKLGYKDHTSLKRHQEAYEHTIKLIVESLAQGNPDTLYDYASSFQRFLNELHRPPYETEISEEEGNAAYWKCVFAPMVAVLLHRFSDEKYEGNAIHFLAKFLTPKRDGEEGLLEQWSPSSDSSKRAKWAKDAIKAQNGLVTPLFTKQVNDIRGTSVRSIAKIKNDILLLKEDLCKLQDEDKLGSESVEKHIANLQSAYIAAMIIRRLEDNGSGKHLKLISEFLGELEMHGSNTDALLTLHNKICDVLLRGDHLFNLWQTEESFKLIEQMDGYLLPLISPTHPGIQEMMDSPQGDIVWPDFVRLKHVLANYELMVFLSGHEQTLLETAFLNYYKMYYYTELEDFDKAFEHCLKVEKASEKVHLGSFLAANLIHKIALHWHLYGTMKHNQFSSEITQIVLHIPDESGIEAAINPVFADFCLSLSDEERMMLNVFRIFNSNHPNVIANPLSSLDVAVSSALRICESISGTVEELLPIYRKEADSKYKRTLSVLPFTRLTLSQSVDMLWELYGLIGITLHLELDEDKRCKQLIKAYDKELMGD